MEAAIASTRATPHDLKTSESRSISSMVLGRGGNMAFPSAPRMAGMCEVVGAKRLSLVLDEVIRSKMEWWREGEVNSAKTCEICQEELGFHNR